MEEILDFIEKKKREFSQLPFFEYLRDQRINPKQRLAFAPCAAPFIMSFGELNKLVFRDEPTHDPIQEIINKHTYEDDHHWLWFLEDLEKLGLNPSEPFTKTLRFLWGEEASASRRVAYELYRHTIDATAIQKLVAIESVEATGNTFLAVSSKLIRELQSAPEQEYNFFGAGHLLVDTGHTYCSPKAKKLIGSVVLTETSKQESFALVNHIFAIFADFVNELLVYAKTHRFDPIMFESTVSYSKDFKPIGSYLLEAGLVKSEQLQEALNQQNYTYKPIGQILASQGLVRQETIEYLMQKVISADRQEISTESSRFLDQGHSKELNRANRSLISPSKPMRLGAYLIEAELVSTEQLQIALEEQKSSMVPIGQILSRNGLVNQQTIEYLMKKVVLPERKVAVVN
jgi:hypothetical protein